MSFLEQHMSSIELLIFVALIAGRILYKSRPFRGSTDKSGGHRGNENNTDRTEKVPFLDASNRTTSSAGASARRNAHDKWAVSRNGSPVSIMAGDV